jgi:UTP--glucose-1-phosphate uridylyltransferase
MARPITKAVLPVAGMGTRFLPATKASPKEMLPLVDKPVIQYVVEEAVASGITTIIMITGRGKRAIEDHFDSAWELERLLADKGKEGELQEIRDIASMAEFAFVRQGEARGLGHAVSCARHLIGPDEPFAVLLGDDVVTGEVPCLAQMIAAYHRAGGPVVAVEEVPTESVSSYGIITPEEIGEGLYKVLDLVEKPPAAEAPSNLAVIGRYILEPDIFKDLDATPPGRGGEIQLTDALRRKAARDGLFGYRFEGKRYDTGDKLGFLIATVELAMQRADLGPAFRAYLRGLTP